MLSKALSSAIAIFIFVAFAQAETLQLELPLVCTLGETCWIQQYAEHGNASGGNDYMCGRETYAGHDGTDFRALNAQADIAVVAAAPGVVKAIRDGVEDKLALSPQDLAAVAHKECGNGVVIAHTGGFETQYCHMRLGSVKVKAGDIVQAGTVLGKVGYSGAAAFAHLHLSVRHNGEKIDPFSGPLAEGCDGSKTSLWSTSATNSMRYSAVDVLEMGWAESAVSVEQAELGIERNTKLATSSPSIVAFGRLIHLRQGDELEITVDGPTGSIATNTIRLDHDKAEEIIFAGAKAQGHWAAGLYHARLLVRRDGKTIVDQASDMTLDQ